jgi:hypothetical protein
LRRWLNGTGGHSLTARSLCPKVKLQIPPLPPDFLSGLVVSVDLMRLSLEKAAYVAVFESSVVGNPESGRDEKVEGGAHLGSGGGGWTGPTGNPLGGTLGNRPLPTGFCPEEVLRGDRLRRDSILDQVLTHQGGQGILDCGRLPDRNRLAPEAVEFCKDTICFRQGLDPPRIGL